MTLRKCKKHGQDLWYILDNSDGTTTIMCQVCFDENVTAGRIKLTSIKK